MEQKIHLKILIFKLNNKNTIKIVCGVHFQQTYLLRYTIWQTQDVNLQLFTL